MRLLQRVASHLAVQDIPFAAIGAAAMAVYGVTLLAGAGAAVAEEVESRIEGLPRESRELWRRLSSR